MPRTIVAAALLLAAGISPAQVREGTYKPTTGAATQWSINDHQTLIWGGQPYLPFGIRIDGTPQAVISAKAAGISDVIVDLPANGIGWDDVLKALNQANMRYLLRIGSLAPMAHGFAIEPQSYRVAGITQTRQVILDIPGATSAFVILASKTDGNAVTGERIPVINGKLSYLATVTNQVEHVLLVYPEMTSIEQQDFWGDLDTERDELLGSLKKNLLGPGLRGIVNPMGRGLATPWREPRFVPTNAYYRMEFSRYLESKYKSVETVLRSWSMTSSTLSQLDEKTKKSLANFDNLAHLIPLWSSTRGISAMFDPESNAIFPCDSHHSEAWDDISKVINAAESLRYSRIVPAIRSVADVPVIQDWLEWASPYETRTPTIDGIGMRVTGSTPSAVADSGSRATSSILRWSTKGWLVATDLDLGSASDSLVQLPRVLDNVTSMGAKGVFLRTDSPAAVKAVVDEARQRSVDPTLASDSPVPVFFPENSYNPAVPQKLSGDHWWLPSPSDGNRIDLGSKFFAYRSGLNEGTFALWTRTPGRYRLDMANPKLAHFRTVDGSDPMPKSIGKGIEITLSEFPLIISGTLEIPIPEVALLETVQRFEMMLRVAATTKRDTSQEESAFNDALTGVQRNPGGSFEIMRKQFWRVGFKIGSFTWLEAERAADTNFSEVVISPGCSGGSALALRTLIPPGPDGYYAEYSVPVKTKDDQEIWIAAKVPAERRGEVSVTIGGQTLRLTGEPLSIYDGGFGWYKLGTTRLAGSLAKLRVHVDSAGTSEIAVDAILLTPGSFTPNGVTPPDPVNFGAIQPKPQKKSKQRGSGGS